MAQPQTNKISTSRYIAILVCFLCTCIVYNANSQSAGIKYLRFTRHNFLASNKVNFIIQDKKEFMWFATSNGIQRFDGNRWLWLGQQKESKTGLPDNYVMSFLEDKQERFWVHSTAGICLLDRNTFEFAPVIIKWLPEHKANTIRSIVQLQDGRVWLTLITGGLYCYDEAAKQFVTAGKIIPLKGYLIYQLVYDSSNKQYYIGTDKGIVIYNDLKKYFLYPGPGPSNNNLLKSAPASKRNVTLHLNNKGELWFSTATTHSCYDIKKDQVIFCDSSSRIWGIMGYTTDKSGTTWGYGNTFAEMNLKTNQIKLIEQTQDMPYGIAFKNGNCLVEDKEHTFWMGTDNGLFIYNPVCQQFFNYSIKSNINDKVSKPVNVWGFIEMKDNTTIVLTDGEEGLYYFDRAFNQLPAKYNMAAYNKTFVVRAGLKSRNNDIWLGGETNYVLKINTVTGKVEKITDTAFAGYGVYSIAEDKAGNIWFGTFRRTIIRRDAVTGMFSKINTFSDGIKGMNVIYHLLPGDDGYIWAGTSQSGLLKINIQTGAIEKSYRNDPANKNSIPSSRINYVVPISDGELMLSSPDGIIIMDIKKESFTLLNTADRLPDNNILNMLADKKNDVWFASDNGISKIRVNGRKVNSYGILEGLTNETFNLGTSLRLKDGRMLFGHSEGFTLFDPARFLNEEVPQNVSITGIKLFATNLNTDSILSNKNGLELNYSQNFLTIEFSNMSFLKRYHIEYFYQLEGVDKDWIRVSGKPEAIYNYLPGGNYTFKVKCKTKGGIASQKITSFKIKIIPPAWKQWWFYLLMVVLVSGFAFFLLRTRYRRKMEAEKVRTRIARDLHDDMGSTLSTINILSEMAKRKIDEDIPATKKFIHLISDNSNRIMESMDDIVWNIDNTNDSIDNVLSRMREFAGSLLEARGIAYTFKEDGQIKKLNFELGRRHDFFMIFKEAVNNLAKYSESTTAIIEITVKKNVLQLIITDNGKGFNPALIKDGNGLINMQRRALALNGRLEIQSEPGNGTIIILRIPV
ncbi:MAG: hypothetical protein H7Y86_03355 [Rhizobacter sp.]|nr:hypothetical protein [Ferruginibacter sp.]